MHFVTTNNLKLGMRIARPIYNKKGECLFTTDSRVDERCVDYLNKQEMIGIYVLDAAEPAPPVSEDDAELERFRFLTHYTLKTEIEECIVTHRLHRMETLADEIIEKYGRISSKRRAFIPDVRSSEDFVFKHSVNVAILSAMLAGRLGASYAEKKELVLASLIHDIGKTLIPKKLLEGETPDELLRILDNSQDTGFDLIDTLFPENHRIKNICIQSHDILKKLHAKREITKEAVPLETKIILVSETFDLLTGVSVTGAIDPETALAAVRYMYNTPEVFKTKIIDALVATVHILNAGETVTLSNKRTALITSINEKSLLYPTVLEFGTNRMLDLSDRDKNGDIEIVDIVRKLDKRYSLGF